MPPIERVIWAAHLPPRFLVPSSLLSPCRILANRSPSSLLPSSQRRTIKSTFTPRPNRFNHHPSRPPLSSTGSAALARKAAAQTLPPRTGALAIKKGMMSFYDPSTGNRMPCTVLQLDRNEVVAVKKRDTHGYWAVQVGAGWKHGRNVPRPMLGHFAAAGVSPKRHVAEFRVGGEGVKIPVGMAIGAEWFREGEYVDARSHSRGMGFAGGMKKHGWAGQPASHGNSLTHRAMGSAGGSQGSGSRVIPGKKMAGRMGNEQRTIQNLKILKVDAPNGLVLVNGSIAGPKGCLVKIQDALKKPWPKNPVAEVTPEVATTQTAAA